MEGVCGDERVKRGRGQGVLEERHGEKGERVGETGGGARGRVGSVDGLFQHVLSRIDSGNVEMNVSVCRTVRKSAGETGEQIVDQEPRAAANVGNAEGSRVISTNTFTVTTFVVGRVCAVRDPEGERVCRTGERVGEVVGPFRVVSGAVLVVDSRLPLLQTHPNSIKFKFHLLEDSEYNFKNI